jgi:alcohol dehydrogenase, propanol-preferring
MSPAGVPDSMRAMVLDAPRKPLRLEQRPVPAPGPGQILLRVRACGVCRTDLHILDGELEHPKLPLIMGHQIVGDVVASGDDASAKSAADAGGPAATPAPHIGDRVGVPWLGWTDGTCRYCRAGQENLCDNARFTGYDIDGGFAEYTVADARYAFPIPSGYHDLQAAPLLCAGLIGYRSLRLAGDDARVLGFYGFGAAAHILTQLAVHQGRRVFAFTRPGDVDSQDFARRMGAEWTGGSDVAPPEELDAAIIFAPVGPLVPAALRAVRKAGVVVCGGIHMSDIPAFPYDILWGERVIRSVANLTRRDGAEFLRVAPEVPIHTETRPFRLESANEALEALREGEVHGAAVLVMDSAS